MIIVTGTIQGEPVKAVISDNTVEVGPTLRDACSEILGHPASIDPLRATQHASLDEDEFTSMVTVGSVMDPNSIEVVPDPPEDLPVPDPPEPESEQ